MASIFNGFLEYESNQELDEYLINKLDKDTALKLIQLSIETLQGQGAFTLVESHALYMCLNKLKQEPKTENDA